MASNSWADGKKLVDATFSPALGSDKKTQSVPLSAMSASWAALAASTEAMAFLAARGIQAATAKKLHFGFAPDKGAVVVPTVTDGVITNLKYLPIREDAMVPTVRMRASLFNLQDCVAGEDIFITTNELEAALLTQAGFRATAYPSAKYNPTPQERDRLVTASRIFLAGDVPEFRALWNTLRQNIYMLRWPDGCSSAADVFLKECAGDVEQFQTQIERLKQIALSEPVQGYFDLSRVLRNSDGTLPSENPRRLHFRNKNVDDMAIILPGSVVSVYATLSGSGKTTWCLDQFELPAVLEHNSVVLNYSAELSPSEFATLVAANLTNSDRLQLTPENYEEAASLLDEGARFYLGYNPDLNRIGLVLDSIEAAIRRLGATVVVLDHLHFLVRGERDAIAAQADAMGRIKAMAVKYQLIFVVVGQSRKAEPGATRRNAPSEASDAKGSETFVSDASAVFCIHRNVRRDIDMSRPESWPMDYLETATDIRCLKSRTKGPGASFARMVFDGQIGKFHPFSAQEEYAN